MPITGCRSLLLLVCLFASNLTWAQTANVTVRLTDTENQIRSVPAPTKSIRFSAQANGSIDEQDNQAALNDLRTYILSQLSALGVQKNDLDFGLKLISAKRENGKQARTFIHFRQTIRRQVNGQEYTVPLESASVIAIFKGDTLERLNSSLVSPSRFSFVAKKPGLDTSMLTVSEQLLFANTLKQSMQQAGGNPEFVEFFNNRLSHGGAGFTLNELAEAKPSEMLKKLSTFLSGMNATGTFRTFISLAQSGKLSLVRYDGVNWMFKVKQLFDLPLEFEIVIPKEGEDLPMRIKNMRSSRHDINVDVYVSPGFPASRGKIGAYARPFNGMMESVDAKAAQTRDIMAGAVAYFSSAHDWLGYDGRGGRNVVVYIGATESDVVDNAYWSHSNNAIVIGVGGSWLFNQYNSPSIIGHEFAHAIVSYSSDLTYDGQSGALNEHFADIQGVFFEAQYRSLGAGGFDFTIGEDAVNNGMDGLRELHTPYLSRGTSFSTMSEFTEMYGQYCQPREDNDRCGVHSGSGIPNRAVSLMLEKIGGLDPETNKARVRTSATPQQLEKVEAIKQIVFTVATRRLNAGSNFNDYMIEMVDECSSWLDARDCDLVKDSFYRVGVKYPGYNPNRPQPQPDKPAPSSVELCGTAVPDGNGNISIETAPGGDYAIILKSNFYVTRYLDTIGYEGDLETKVNTCQCVTGRRGRLTNSAGNVFNRFETFEGSRSCESSQNIPTPTPAPREQNPAKLYCGWINAASPGGNMNIIDNKFDAFILASDNYRLKGLATEGEFSHLYALNRQCGCVSGVIDQVPNSAGKMFNRFKTVVEAYQIPTSSCARLTFK